jgi:hypothetical protein
VYTKLAVLRSDMYAEANRRQCPRRAGHRARPPNSGQVSVELVLWFNSACPNRLRSPLGHRNDRPGCQHVLGVSPAC